MRILHINTWRKTLHSVIVCPKTFNFVNIKIVRSCTLFVPESSLVRHFNSESCVVNFLTWPVYKSEFFCSCGRDMSSFPFCAEYDKRGAAKCKRCKDKLEKGQLRIGKIVPNPFSESGGDMKAWHHVDCLFETFKRARATTKKLEDPIDDLEGWEDLEVEDKNKIQDLISDLQNNITEKVTPKKQTPKKTTTSPKKTPQSQTKHFQAGGQASKPKAHAMSSKYDGGGSSDGPSHPRNEPGMDRTLKDNAFKEFRRICANVADEPSYLEKTSIISKFLTYGTNKAKFEGDLRLWVKLLLPGVIKRVYNLQSKQLVKLFSQLFNSNQEEMLEDLEQGDIAETVRKFFEESVVLQPAKKSFLSIQEVDELLEDLSGMTREEEQSSHLKKIAKKCTGNDLRMVVRLIKGDLRINAGAKHILDAVHPDAYEAFQTTRNIDAVLDQILIVGRNGGSLKLIAQVMTPVLPMLAEACKSVDYAFKKCVSGSMYAEIKYDGERVQVHKQGNKFMYFSRSLKPVMPHKVNHFKEYIPKAFPFGEDLILDAEVLMIDTKTGNPLPFGTLGIHKKAEFQDASVCLFVFDCIHYNGEDLMDKPISARRKILEEKMIEIKNHIMFSEFKLIKKKEDLREMINHVLKQGLEGLVLKDVNSIYEPGKRHWLKVKKDYLNDGAMADSADLVVLGAWYGTGKKGGMMSVFLMGCHDPRIKKWCTVTKVHTGHDDATLARLQNELDMVKISQDVDRVPSWLKCTKTMVPDFVCADPKKAPVWEITGAEFTRHQIHTADGISIRFPRVTRIRDDKTWEQATDLLYLQELYKKSRENSDFEGLSTARMDVDDYDDESNSKDGTSGSSTPVKVSEDRRVKSSSSGSHFKNSPKRMLQAKVTDFKKEDSGKKLLSIKQEKEDKDVEMRSKIEANKSRECEVSKQIKKEQKPVKQEKEEKYLLKPIKRESDESFSLAPVKKPCKYGVACHSKSLDHLNAFEHPTVSQLKHPTINPLPDFLNGVKLVLLNPVEKINILQRYVIAYGGEILPEYCASEATHFITTSKISPSKPSHESKICVSENWLWDSIKLLRLQPTRPYIV